MEDPGLIQDLDDLVIQADLFDAAAAVNENDAITKLLDALGKIVERGLTEKDLRRNLNHKLIHVLLVLLDHD